MKIRPLDSDVIKKLRSGVSITTVAQCVDELIWNAIDAGASCIAVHLNLPFYRIQVIDNGEGIPYKHLKLVGSRYATSKCHTLEDLKSLCYGGFRGEALSSIKEISSVLMIESRFAGSKETFCKIFTQGNSSEPKKSINSRPSKGTTVSIFDFMYNMPVRKKSISETLDLEECRKVIQSISLMHPFISFSLKNEITGEMSLQFKKCSSLIHAFVQLYGKNKADSLKSVKHQIDEYKISGYISTDGSLTKDKQFLYVNKRRILRTKIHKLINAVLNKVLGYKNKSNFGNVNSLTSDSPSKSQVHCGLFVLNISCPYDTYDIMFDPKKTVIEFIEWNKVLKLVEDAILMSLAEENPVSNSCNEAGSLNLSLSKIPSTLFPNHDEQCCGAGLFSHVVKRSDVQILTTPPNMKRNLENINLKDSEGKDDSLIITPIGHDFQKYHKSSKIKNTENIVNYRKSVSAQSSMLVSESLESSNVTMMHQYHSKPALVSSDSFHVERELDIPCRSIFPSKSPVMLRIPIKSTLSELEAASSNSNALSKLKEKFQYVPLNRKSLHVSNKPTKDNKNYPYNAHNLKSATESDKFDNTVNEFHGRVVLKNKFSQCPSVSVNDKKRVVSKYSFGKETHLSPFQRLRATRYKKNCLENDMTVNIYRSKKHISFTDEHEISEGRKIKLITEISDDIEKRFCSNISENPERAGTHKNKEQVYLENADFSQLIYDSQSKQFYDTSCRDVISEYSNNFDELENSSSSTFAHLSNSSLFLKTFGSSANNKEQNKSRKSEKSSNFHLTLSELSNSNFSVANTVPHKKTNENFNELQCVKINPNNDSSFLTLEHVELDTTNRTRNIVSNTDSSSEINTEHSVIQNLELQLPEKAWHFPPLNSAEKYFLSTNDNGSSELAATGLPEHTYSVNVVSHENIDVDTSPVIPLQHEINSNSLCSMQGNILPKSDLVIQSAIGTDIQEIDGTQLPSPLKKFCYEPGKKYSCDLSATSQPLLYYTKNSSSTESKNPNTDCLFESNQNTIEFISQDKCLNNFNLISGALVRKKASEVKMDVDCVDSSIDESFSYNDRNVGCESSISSQNDYLINSKCMEAFNHISPDLLRSSHKEPKEDGKEVSVPSDQDDCSINKTASDLDRIEGIKELPNGWIYQKDPETNRLTYLHAVTGNSAYVIPDHVDPNPSIENTVLPDNNIEDMFNNWENPMFSVPLEVNSVQNSVSDGIPQMYRILNSYRFSKSTLNSLQVIGQVDCKFIACLLQNFSENCKEQKLLALFDQHAVHERIRLEEITENLYEAGENGRRKIKSSNINPPLKIAFEPEEIRILNSYHGHVQQIGIYMSIDYESEIANVFSIPSCLFDSETNELCRKVPEVVGIIKNTIKEWLISLMQTRSVSCILPKALSSVLNSQACRGAVKFGDPLDISQCEDLLLSLSKCKLPFQCAHGRPSIAPILDLKRIESIYKKKSSPQLWKLSEAQK